MRKIYFTVDYETENINEVKELTGNKTVTVYSIENNEPKKFFDLDLTVSDNSIQSIKDYLNDNGYEDKTFEIIQL